MEEQKYPQDEGGMSTDILIRGGSIKSPRG